MFGKLISRNRDLFIVVGVIAIIMVLFVPIPSYLLDLLLIVNFSLAMTILLLAFYVGKPVEFSTFPSLLLVTTLYRLGLNVAATRLILTQANAGQVIGAIGSFAVQGSFIVGLVVFFILVVVQYIVVTAGAQRVSEVAARFVLDSLPGQQMSIDADLNMGLIDQNQAKRRRKELEKEASFYGAMDGASKFVKGDAVAGIIILLINIFAGWAVGILQLGMDWLQALQNFTLLTIGDGIVTQAPALIISIATGIIVTRSSSDRQLSEEVLAQLTSVPKAPLIVLAVLFGLLLMPGMPKWPILLLMAAVGGLWLHFRRKGRALDVGGSADILDDHAPATVAAGMSTVEVRLGSSIAARWQPLRSILTDRIATLRIQQEKLSGFAFPNVSFEEDRQLELSGYEIDLFGARHANGVLHPDMTLAIRSSSASPLVMPGPEVKDPVFGLPGVWIEDDMRDQARGAGYTLVDPITVMITHLGEVLRREASMMLSRADTAALLEGVRARQPGLVEELVPTIMTISDVQRVLQQLLSEDVSIRNLDLICETLVDCGRNTKDHAELAEFARQRLCHGICHSLRGEQPQLSVLTLNPRVEAQITDNLRRSEGRAAFPIEPRLAEQLIRKLMPLAEAMTRQSLAPVLICGPDIRRHLKAFTRRTIPKLAVLSVNEVPSTVDLRSFEIVNIE